MNMANKAYGDNAEEFRELLRRIGDNIDDGGFEALRYQCKSKMGPGKLERLANVQELFEALEQLDEINEDDQDFLLDILINIDRTDLCKVVKEYQMTKERTLIQKEPFFNVEFDASHKAEDSKLKKEYENCDQPNSSVIRTNQSNLAKNDTVPFPTSGYEVTRVIPPDLQRGLDFVISEITRGWQMVARHLRVPDRVIEDAEYNWPRSIRSQVRDTFRYWARNDSNPSLQRLISALRSVRRNDLADRIEMGIY